MKTKTRTMLLGTVAAAGALLALGSTRTLSAGETKLTRAQVPAAVVQAAAQRQPSAEMTGFAREQEKGKTVYEVELRAGDRSTDLIYTPDGKLLVEETTLSLAELPAAVRQGLAGSPFAKAKVLKVEKVTHTDRPGAPIYELLVQSGEHRHELELTADGRIAKQENQGEADEEQGEGHEGPEQDEGPEGAGG